MERREESTQASVPPHDQRHHEAAAHGARARPHPPGRGLGRVTFVLDRDLRVLEVVCPTNVDGRVHNWMDLVDASDHAAAYDALSRALVSHRTVRCELRFTRHWPGHVLPCTFLRSPLSRAPGGFLVHVDAP